MIVNQQIFSLSKKKLVFLFWSLSLFFYAQDIEAPFKTFYSGKSFTSIAVENNTNVWAGTDKQGLYFLDRFYNEEEFVEFNINTSPDLSSIRIQSLATDRFGNIWVGHAGTSATKTQGGMERINLKNNFEVQHFSPDRDMRGTSYLERDGLGTLDVQQVVVDSNNIVWLAHKYHDLTVTGIPSSYIITPGTFASRRADNYSGRFDAVSTWKDYQENNEDPGLLYPDYTDNPGPTDPVSSRTCNAISANNYAVWVSVYYYTAISEGYKPSRLLQYDSDRKFIKGHTLADAGFSNGMIFHAVYHNNKGLWATTPAAGDGFSVFKGESWHNIKDPKIIPPGTRFNAKSIWGDALGRVYLGTDKGLIVFDGQGSPTDINSYTLYTKTAYDSPRSKHYPDMLSNNITAGASEVGNPFYSWIATPEGIMRGLIILDEADVKVFNIKDRKHLYEEKIETTENYIPLTTLSNTLVETSIPYFATDGTTSTVIRYKTGIGIAKLFYNTEFKFRIKGENGGDLPINEDNEKFIERYGKFDLKPIDKYEKNAYRSNYKGNLDSLKYVDIIYTHPTHIENLPDWRNKAKYKLQLIWDSDPKEEPIVMFRHTIGFSLPPILLAHGVWTDIFSLNKLEGFLLGKGFSSSEIIKVWRTDKEEAENTFEVDAHIIPEYINKLKNKALLGNKVSAGKVNVIAHSRGGLYTRAYIEELSPMYPYNDDINSLITLNSPHFGSQLANLVLDKRPIIPKINLINSLPIPGAIIISNLSNLDNIPYTKAGPYSIGDIFTGIGRLAVISEKEKDSLQGAKHLTVTIDMLSLKEEKETKFIGRLNEASNLTKFSKAKVPFHVVTTSFEACKIDSSLCKIHTQGPLKPPMNNYDKYTKITKFIGKLTVALKIVEGIVIVSKDVLPPTIDGFMEYVFNGEANDFVVPESSMKANLDSKYISTFPDDNIMHVDLLGIEEPLKGTNWSGVLNNTKVNEKLFELLKQDFNSSTTNFTKNGISKYTELPYNFLPGFIGFSSNKSSKKLLKNEEKVGKILIDPESFSSNMYPGETVSFDIYQENLDEIVVTHDYPYLNDMVIGEKTSGLSFKNTLFFDIPEEFVGEFSITAYGFIDGQLVTIHTVKPSVKIPSSLQLESIRFDVEEDEKPEITEQTTYSYNLIGTFSDGIERRINDIPEISFTIDDTNVLKQIDNETVEGIIPGEATLTATAGQLTAELKITVSENSILKQTLITDFYAEVKDTQTVDVEWKTLHEFQSKLFTLEKSENDDQNFVQIDQQNGQGTLYEKSNYSFSDTTGADVVYYKLSLYNQDDELEFSGVIKVEKKNMSVDEGNTKRAEDKDRIIIAPNPLKDFLGSLFINSTIVDQNAVLNIYDINGRLISSKKHAIDVGEQKINFEIPSGAANGVYLIQLKTNKYIKTLKVILQR
jgi:hypothetical protein